MDRLGWSAVVVTLAAVGCGGISARDYCSQRVQASCEWYVACGKTALTVQECVDAQAAQEDCAAATDATFCEAGLRYDGAKAEACLGTLAGTDCTEAVPGGLACDEICHP